VTPLPAALAAALAQPGRAAIPFRDAAVDPQRLIMLHCYRAPGHQPDGPVVFVQHGMGRNGEEYRDYWVPAADRHGLLVVAPTFAVPDWPTAGHYNNGLPRDAAGHWRPRDSWCFASPARVMAALREAGVTTRAQAHMFGHSAGGQFVHRLLSTQGAGPLGAGPFGQAIAANAGWYTLPTLDRPYPEGLGSLGLTRADLASLLGFPLLVLAGEGDTTTTGPSLPMQPEAVRQGPHRFARAAHYLEFGRAEAARLGLTCAWRLQTVPLIGHDGAAMSRVAASLWFDGTMPPMADLARWAEGGGSL
jgi:poly(3-hydroxybutyrate) depolymerase